MMQQETVHAMRLVGLSMAFDALGRKPESDAALAELIAKNEKTYSFSIAYVFAYRGDADRAFEWLHKAVQYHDPYPVAVAGHPMFVNIHDDRAGCRSCANTALPLSSSPRSSST
jgi:hypothetical protein